MNLFLDLRENPRCILSSGLWQLQRLTDFLQLPTHQTLLALFLRDSPALHHLSCLEICAQEHWRRNKGVKL